MLPKIIHQIWEGRTEYLRDSYKLSGETWKEHHPDWTYELWEENRMDDFVYDHFPGMIDIYYGYPYSIQRWHAIRYLIMYQMGGMYADFDYECLEPFDKHITDESKCYFAMDPEQHCRPFGKSICFNNALMIAPPGHPFFKQIIAHLQTMPVSYAGDKYREVQDTTGLWMLTNLYEKYTYKNTVGFLPAEQVSPFSKNEVQDYIQGKADEELLEKKLQKAIAIHYFRGSWLIKNDTSFLSKQPLTHMPVSDLYRIFMQYPAICIDSRMCSPDSLYFAIQGYSKDGNKFAGEALEAGCRYAIVDDPTVITDNRYILVDNVLQTLQQLAGYHHQILKTPVIGITGTCGKTTTKELTAAVLSTKYKLVCTPGSENGSLNASLVLLSLKPEHEIAVIEMGACCCGMIREAARVVRPNYGIVTNVGLAHLDRFGSFEGVIRSKGELYDYLRQSGGKVFIHKENTYLHSIVGGLEQISYGESKDAFISGRVVSSDPCLCFDWENAGVRHTVSTHLAGDYNLWNALAAITVGVYFDVPSTEINRAISDYVPTNHRSQWKKTLRNELIIDTFNANPTSMQAALASFSTLTAKPKAVILGDMLGLGTESLQLHTEIIEKLNGYGFEKVLLCGDQFTVTGSAYPCFPDVEALGRYLSENPFQGYTVLIKGSNKILLWKIINLL
jgi:UDP-N-acetylmuramoyl-tripeptide--D-alanyl-D-alanine ligase